MKTRIAIQPEPFDLAGEVEALSHGDLGAIASFIGYVRAEGGLTALVLEHYPGMTEREIALQVEEAARRWPLLGCDGLAAGIEHSDTAQAFLGGRGSLVTRQTQELLGRRVDVLDLSVAGIEHQAVGHRGHHCVHPAQLCSEILVHRVPFRAQVSSHRREPSNYSREWRPCNRDRTAWRLRQFEA